MKLDEYNLLCDLPQELAPKRREFILKKWEKRGWINRKVFDSCFNEFLRIQQIAKNLSEHTWHMDGRVVIVEFLEHPHLVKGILEDHGDNGWSLYTCSSCQNNTSLYLGNFEDVAYVDLHPEPRKLWSRMNHLYWKLHKRPDRFHKKISSHSPGTVCDYANFGLDFLAGRAERFVYTNPEGAMGDCYPHCQCKFL